MKQALLILPILFLLQSCGFEIVDEGHIGVKKSLGKVVGEALDPGIHFYNPLTTGISELSIREEKLKANTMAYTQDLQNVDVAFTVNYRPEKNFMLSFYKEYGNEYAAKIIPQIISASIKEVVGTYKAGPLVEKRQLAQDAIKTKLFNALASKHITLTDFRLTNLDYNDKFEHAVEAKVIAKEKAVEETNRTVQVKEQAAQKLLRAEADAKAIAIKAKALSKNKDLIQLEAVKKWNGVLPTMTTGGGAVPFINITPGSK